MVDVIFNGPAGRLEGRYFQNKSPRAPMAIFLHPHPQHGGTMDNKLVYLMYDAFRKLGFSTLRFNFRGVGRSQGSFDNGEGELSDAAAAMDWMQAQNPNSIGCCVAGFSFGSWIGMQLLMRRPDIDAFISLAPPANLYDFNFLAPCPSSGMIVQGLSDEIVKDTDVEKLVKKLSSQKGISIDYRTVKGADHFFANHMDILRDHINDYIKTKVAQIFRQKGA